MPLFQKSVVSKYLKSQNQELLSAKWSAYKSHFLNPKVQEDIKELKEEQYQGEFLEDLFVKILGYTKPASSSETKFNLTTEYKNVKDSKKADGAIIFDDKVKAVIELKGTNTTDLGKIEVQAFGYKNNQPDCVYVITSNFEKLRFYIDNAIEHIEFNLFNLTEYEFQLLYLCLGFDNLSQNIAKKIKDESLSEEDVITKKLYKDYSFFKRELHQNLVLLNPQFEPLELFKKSQKLLDRFLFLFFGEDRHLLPPNSVRLILSDWKDLQERDVEIPLYDRFKKYFEYLNVGYKGKRYDVFAYNGGLFKPDEVLDAINIDDDLLYKHTFKLSEYDFSSEVDVNILGHIFENSLNELDEIKAQLEGLEIDKCKTKRKKDGVFYTPKYITKYIVENTVGKLCEEKKVALEIIEEEYFTDKKRQKKTIQGLVEKLNAYRKWLLQLTICDPACGSGAFLNQALDFLITEHRYIDELQAKLFGDALVMSDIENSILENNLFGVDLNEESVEIAKLSLWLRTAQPNRKLNDLNNNLKCGNSLIDDIAVDGDKAFNWQTAFPNVFRKGGFDVIIGNPPYITFALGAGSKHDDLQTEHLKQKYKSANYKVSSYLIFFEKGIDIMNDLGVISYIIPNTYHNNYYFKDFREFLINNTKIEILANITYKVFDDAEMGFTSIPIVRKGFVSENHTTLIEADNVNSFLNPNKTIHLQSDFLKYPDNKFLFGANTFIWNKANDNSVTLENKIFKFYNGIKTGNNDKFLSKEKHNDSYRPIISGKDFSKYYVDNNIGYVLYNPKELWSNTNEEMFITNEKLIFRRTSDSLLIAYDNKKRFCLDTIHLLFCTTNEINHKYLLSILNSKFLNFLYRIIVPEVGKAFAEVKIVNLKKLPIKIIDLKNQHPFIEKAEHMLSKNKEIQEQSQKFQRTIQRKFELEDLPKKLQDWYLLSYAEFIKELGKKKVKLSLSEEAEWEDYFNSESKKALELKATIDATDKAIDKMVYELYGLSEEEIAIVKQG